MKKFLAIILSIILVSCTPANTAIPTGTPIPTATFTPIPPTLTSTPKPTNTAVPIIYVTLGSPFASDCGDGIPRIWSNKSFNGADNGNGCWVDGFGHVDLFVPAGCEIDSYTGEVVAPASGSLVHLRENIYNLVLPNKTYLSGIEDALIFAGIQNPSLSRISKIQLNFGHMTATTTGNVEVGQKIGEIVPAAGHHKLAYQIKVVYGGVEYWFTPTIFIPASQEAWSCVSNSPYPCQPESNFLPPVCK